MEQRFEVILNTQWEGLKDLKRLELESQGTKAFKYGPKISPGQYYIVFYTVLTCLPCPLKLCCGKSGPDRT